MEIPVINFEAGINSLNNPSLISRFLSIFELGKLSPNHRLWKWGALFLALVYAFTSIINKIKILFLYYHNKSKSILASEPLLSYLDDEFSSDDDDDESDDNCSSSDYSSGLDEDEEEEEEEEELEDVNCSFGEDFEFNVKGSFCNFSENTRQMRKIKGSFRRKRSFIDNISLSDFVSGESVVKLWDGLSLGVLDVNNAFSFLDFNSNEYMCNSTSIFDAISPSSKVFLSGDGNIWDLRTGFDSPAVHSNRKGKVVGVDSGRTGKVYVRDDITTGLTACDVRKFDTPLTEELTAYEDEMWWDANGVNELD